MQKEYRIAKGWAIFMYIFCPPLILLMGWLALFPLFSDPIQWTLFAIFFPMGIGIGVVTVIGMLDIKKSVFVIAQDRVYITSTLAYHNRSLGLDEIEGYRLDDKYYYIIPSDKKKKKISISKYYGKQEEIQEWLSSHYHDLDLLNAQREVENILQDEELGRTIEERQEKLKRAKIICNTINWVSAGVGIWAYIWPNPYEYVIISLTLLFAVSVLAVRFVPLVKIFEDKSSGFPSVFIGLLLSGITLAIRALLDFSLYELSNLLSMLAAVVTGLFVVITIRNHEIDLVKKDGIIKGLCLVFFLLFFGYGSIIEINCLYDRSDPINYSATILDKRISSGKHTSYYLSLTAWGNHAENEEVTVSHNMYNELEIGDEVQVSLFSGKLGVPWYDVSY